MMQTTKPMRIAHCSDLHLLSLAGSRTLDFANKRWIGGLNLLTNRGRHYHTEVFESLITDVNDIGVDHILVTGDITNLALEEEFRFARDLFERFNLGPNDITVLPGNHDAYVEEGARYYTEHFAPYFSSDDGFGDDPWPLVRLRGGVAILGLSTSLETPWFTAWGRVGEAQLRRLQAALSDARVADCFRLVAIHHAPAGPPAKSRIRGLRDRQGFADVVAEAGCDLILHGHEHRDLRAALHGPRGAIQVRGIQSGTYEGGKPDRRARYRIYTVEDGAITGEEVRVWEPKEARFIAESCSQGAELVAVSGLVG